MLVGANYSIGPDQTVPIRQVDEMCIKRMLNFFFRGGAPSYDKFSTPSITSYQSPAGTQSNVGSQVRQL